MHRWAAAALVTLLALPLAGKAQDLATAERAYFTAEAALDAHMDLNWLDDDPASPARLEAVWKAEQDWATAWLNSHPDATAAVFACAAKSFSGIGAPIALDGRSYLLATIHGEMGQLFIVTRRDHRFVLAWSTAEAGADAPGDSPLRDWTPARRFLLYGGASILPPDARGRPRFAIDALNAGMGETLGAQTSIWVWTGASAQLLFLKRYVAFIDGVQAPRPAKDVFSFTVKDEFRSWTTTYGDAGRELDWRVKLLPDGVKDLGGVSLTPEADLADELFQRILHHRDASDLATAQVVAAVRRGFLQDGEPDEGFGMVVRTVRGQRRLCLDTGPAFLFMFNPKGHKPAIRAARELKSGACNPRRQASNP